MNSISPQTRDWTPLEEFDSALDWWREAGVDCDFADVPRNWLSLPDAGPEVDAPRSPKPPPVQPPRTPLQRTLDAGQQAESIGGARDAWPRDLAAFGEWWLREESLGDAATALRVSPRGTAGARLMVLTGEPIADEAENRLLAAILRAMGLGEADTYLASALPAAVALPDWSDLAVRGMAAVTAHHVALAKPQRVLAFGRDLAPLFGIAPEQAREPATFAAGDGAAPLLLVPDLAQIARVPARRRNFWNRWLDWTR